MKTYFANQIIRVFRRMRHRYKFVLIDLNRETNLPVRYSRKQIPTPYDDIFLLPRKARKAGDDTDTKTTTASIEGCTHRQSGGSNYKHRKGSEWDTSLRTGTVVGGSRLYVTLICRED